MENLGNFDARRGEKAEFKADRIKHWMSVGAQVSPTVHNLLVSRKIIEGKKINVLPKKKPIVKETPTETESKALSAQIAPKALSEEVVAEAPVENSAETPVA